MAYHLPDFNLEKVLIEYFKTILTTSTFYQRFEDVEKEDEYISIFVNESEAEETNNGNWNCSFNVKVISDLKQTTTLEHDTICGSIIDEFFKPEIEATLNALSIAEQIELTIFDIRIRNKRNDVNEYQMETIISGNAYLMPD